jgi:hypothetical protein
MTNFGKRLILEQRMKDNSSVVDTSSASGFGQGIASHPTEDKGPRRGNNAVDYFVQDDSFEPVRPTIGGKPQG